MKIVQIVPYDKKEDCCGCTFCYAICPVHAIEMVRDEEGFLYPRINTDVCIGCQKCSLLCPFHESVQMISK